MNHLKAWTIPGVLMTVVLMSTVLISACSGLTSSDQPPVRTFMLMPLATTAAAGTVVAVDVSVSVVPGLDTDKILTLSSNAELNHYASAVWAEHTPELMESLVTRSLQASGRFDVVSRLPGGGLEDCSLALEIQSFYVYLGSANLEARLVTSGQYVCGDDQSLSVHSSEAVPVRGTGLSAVVAAFQEAVNATMRDILDTI